MHVQIRRDGGERLCARGARGADRVAVVAKKSTCKRCKCDLEKGTTCYEIPELGGTFANYRRFCAACFKRILAKTQEKLNELSALVGT
jgi:hypothetical protein